MDRQTALVLTIIFFAIFTVLLYYGVQITIWSSIALSTFISLILLNIFYPPSQMAQDTADFTLVVYAIIIILGLALLAIYIGCKAILDVRY